MTNGYLQIPSRGEKIESDMCMGETHLEAEAAETMAFLSTK